MNQSTSKIQRPEIPPSLQLICHDISQFYVNYRQLCIINHQYHLGKLTPSEKIPISQIQDIVEQCRNGSHQFVVFVEALYKLLNRTSITHRSASFDLVFGLVSRILIERDILPTFSSANTVVISLLLESIALIFESLFYYPPTRSNH